MFLEDKQYYIVLNWKPPKCKHKSRYKNQFAARFLPFSLSEEFPYFGSG